MQMRGVGEMRCNDLHKAMREGMSEDARAGADENTRDGLDDHPRGTDWDWKTSARQCEELTW